jgi:hypothetical protein
MSTLESAVAVNFGIREAPLYHIVHAQARFMRLEVYYIIVDLAACVADVTQAGRAGNRGNHSKAA